MEALIDRIQERQIILSDYFKGLAHEKNNAVGSTKDYAAVIDLEGNHFC